MSTRTNSPHAPGRRIEPMTGACALGRLERDAKYLARRLDRLATEMRELVETHTWAAAAREIREEHRVGGSTGLCDLAGPGLSAVGALLVLAVIIVHQALALPLSELPARPGLWPGLLMIASGLVLVHTSRQGRQASRESGLPAQAAASVNSHVDGKRSMV